MSSVDITQGRMSRTIHIRIWLKIPDAEAATLKNTLRRRMGYGELLEDVRRERLISVEIDSGDPEEVARALVRELVNENKESHRVTIDELGLEEGYTPVKVALHIEDGEAISIRNRLRNRLGLSSVSEVRRATIWKLYLKENGGEKAARQIAEGLLINPHKDSYEILHARSIA
ncbi:MAG: phosphoribosylformylglycinamidine synthase subunit PurS [Methanothrix sp.]|nr:phosphoribosylformylglycinamidine synthase subunit PurS [Methanothrix sp.]